MKMPGITFSNVRDYNANDCMLERFHTPAHLYGNSWHATLKENTRSYAVDAIEDWRITRRNNITKGKHYFSMASGQTISIWTRTRTKLLLLTFSFRRWYTPPKLQGYLCSTSNTKIHWVGRMYNTCLITSKYGRNMKRVTHYSFWSRSNTKNNILLKKNNACSKVTDLNNK